MNKYLAASKYKVIEGDLFIFNEEFNDYTWHSPVQSLAMRLTDMINIYDYLDTQGTIQLGQYASVQAYTSTVTKLIPKESKSCNKEKYINNILQFPGQPSQ